MFQNLSIALAGNPLSAPADTVAGLKRAKELGISAMELEWVHGVRLTEDRAEEIGKTARDLGIQLTVHGPYYINLAAKEPEKMRASIQRIYDTAFYGSIAGAKSITFHAGFYMGEDPKTVFQIISINLEKIQEKLMSDGISIDVRPELTGKGTQFGSIDELIELTNTLGSLIKPCIDFAHQHARNGGGWGTYDKYIELLEKLETGIGKELLHDMHMHFSGINYTVKGERNHLPFAEADNNYKDLLRALHDKKVTGQLVIESPVMEEDVLLAMKEWQLLAGK